jgi:hypothetical protein
MKCISPLGPPRAKRDVRGRALRNLPRSRPIPQTRVTIHRTLPRHTRRGNGRWRRRRTEPAGHPDARAACLPSRLPCAHRVHANGPAQRTTTATTTAAAAVAIIAPVPKRARGHGRRDHLSPARARPAHALEKSGDNHQSPSALCPRLVLPR